MDEPISLPADAITLGVERPLRMAVETAQAGAPALVGPAKRPSAVPAYTAPLSFDWRKDEPLAAARRAKESA
jgi:hypothetical protein